MLSNEVKRGVASRELYSERDRYEESIVVQETEAYKIDCSSLGPENEGSREVAQCEEAQVSREVLHSQP